MNGGRADSEDGSAAAEEDVPAVAYVRMSTDHQKYSTENQLDVIRSYAEARGLQILRVFEDSGRSGLRLDGREALQNLMAEVQSGDADFKAILVYDVSRWGRFQDADEGAYHEHVCSRAGTRVHYCGEQFENDGSIGSNLLKTVKRVMAGEYSRELSVKVFAGQCRLVELGYRQGGAAGPGPNKRGDRGRRRTVGRIERGGGDGGDPARSPPGWLEFSPAARPRTRLRSIRGVSELGPLRHARILLHEQRAQQGGHRAQLRNQQTCFAISSRLLLQTAMPCCSDGGRHEAELHDTEGTRRPLDYLAPHPGAVALVGRRPSVPENRRPGNLKDRRSGVVRARSATSNGTRRTAVSDDTPRHPSRRSSKYICVRHFHCEMKISRLA